MTPTGEEDCGREQAAAGADEERAQGGSCQAGGKAAPDAKQHGQKGKLH